MYFTITIISKMNGTGMLEIKSINKKIYKIIRKKNRKLITLQIAIRLKVKKVQILMKIYY